MQHNPPSLSGPFGISDLRFVISKPAAEKRWVLIERAIIYAAGEDALSLHRIGMLVPSSDLEAFQTEVVDRCSAIAENARSERKREHWTNAAFVAWREFDEIMFDRDAAAESKDDRDSPFSAELSTITPKAKPTTLPTDRRKSDLCRIAFRALRNGTTRSKLAAHMAEANSMLQPPLSRSELSSLTDWCVKTHLEEKQAKQTQGTQHAA
jgi:hypothetical protein